MIVVKSISEWIEEAVQDPKVIGKAKELDRLDYQDLIQEAAVKILKVQNDLSFESINQVIRYFHLIMIRSVNYRRNSKAKIFHYKKKSNICDIDECYDLPDPVNEYARRDSQLDFEKIKDLIKKPSWNEFLTLYYEYGYTFTEIAKMKKTSLGTIAAHHQRILEELRWKLNIEKIH